ncbi:hypothetical protein HOC01_04905 [archaeon]|jgi:hypothetical protein|nr:hypothetical protein [archaeon]MBT6698307.1 hypothetical protein [archaeon]
MELEQRVRSALSTVATAALIGTTFLAALDYELDLGIGQRVGEYASSTLNDLKSTEQYATGDSGLYLNQMP